MQANQLGAALSTIAGVLGTSLKYSKKEPHIELDGPSTVSVQFLPNLPLRAEITLVGVLIGEQVGVMVHLVGDLHIFPVVNLATNATTVYLLDGSKSASKGARVSLGSNLGKRAIREVITDLQPAIVAAFFLRGGSWHPLKLPL